MKCPACDHEAPQADFGEPLQCPDCGAYYQKALAAKIRKEQQAEVAAPVAVPASRRFKDWKMYLGLLAVTIMVYLAVSPYLSVYQIKRAVDARDSEALAGFVDFPKVRESLKAQMNSVILKSTEKELKDNPFAAIGMALAGAMVDKMVDVYGTPAGLAQMLRGDEPSLSKKNEKPSVYSYQAPVDPSKGKALSNAKLRYDGVNKFIVSTPVESGKEASFILSRQGLSWAITDIRIPF